jgi:hypothetical protein
MNSIELEQAVEQAQQALLSLREAERELGWALAREKLGILAPILDDEVPDELPD